MIYYVVIYDDRRDICGGFHKLGYPKIDGFCEGTSEHPTKIRMMTRDTPISGNLQMALELTEVAGFTFGGYIFLGFFLLFFLKNFLLFFSLGQFSWLFAAFWSQNL